ncbi:uncharacterized protein OCT59_025998 [Rhizophagus irregularis]|uniref:Uncharacterized protein n=6 Tax=Rhizophagus irregularis TaxID=588596 RepID=A0A2I1E7H9_9GLOM|nr:hypothetical protein GLOIN_2v1590884 [Rhizophagus irregularis DAOM 181602=DAOM 197198]EXX60070.1 hypothetical protein RirG_183240 [Rhizophagus irregularis DAOM 197198w]PKY18082.1 hypothetical protein RhiirB3_405132 [Rhizophagus irregularis]POG72955.1 hypothetical protein GLOIN_2v1590884 [Rhizophagus irregularis DAOM 181602=DAOM 197198]UZO05654.1 hypothetical protein OCT59_025998 [Rhizophagus irregularis]CAB5350003.1 unnamed protein product [Rhizophagus irregularis]|eukprot:XP_025179821.1 hypothetical protein GLOIN_2v1590884 [Rhizophagus irregularis DAOM 181602=DAOM 197198]
MAKLTSIPIDDTTNSGYTRYQTNPRYIRTEAGSTYSQSRETTASRFSVRLDNTFIDSNPLLKSLYDQVDSMLQQSSGQDVTKIFFTILVAIDKNLSNPNSPLSMNSDANDLRRLYSIPSNGRMNITLSLMRPPQQFTTSSSSHEEIEESTNLEDFDFSSYHRIDSDLLPPPPETWTDSDMTSLIDQATEEMEKSNNTSYAYGAYR